MSSKNKSFIDFLGIDMIAIGSDHAGYSYKEEIKSYLKDRGLQVKDYGTFSEESVDYPDFGIAVGQAVAAGECEKGILFCGTGVGISVSANKVRGIRAVACSEPFSAKMSRLHNDSNVLALGSRVVGIELAKMIIDIWLETEFEGGRHQRRVDKIIQFEDRRK